MSERSCTCSLDALDFVERRWEEDVLPTLTRYIEIPAKSPAFDPEWAAHGHIDRAVALIEDWSRRRPIEGLTVETVRLPGRTPLILLEVPGTSAGGLVIASVGVAPAFAVSGAGHLLVIATLATLGVEGRPRRQRPTTIRQDIAEGLAYALRTPEIRALLGVLFVISFCAFNFSMWVPLLARNVLGQGAQEFGFLMAAVGVGAVSGALTLGTVVPRQPPLALLHASAAAACAVLLALSVIESFSLTAVALFLLAYAGVITAAGCNTALQLGSSDELRGRVMSLFTLIHGGSFPMAAFLIGAVSERWSEGTAFFVSGAGGLAALAVLMGARHRPVVGNQS